MTHDATEYDRLEAICFVVAACGRHKLAATSVYRAATLAWLQLDLTWAGVVITNRALILQACCKCQTWSSVKEHGQDTHDGVVAVRVDSVHACRICGVSGPSVALSIGVGALLAAQRAVPQIRLVADAEPEARDDGQLRQGCGHAEGED